MKKFIVFAVVLALLVPAAAFAATEFSLGGFIKLDAMWDSNSAVGKNINGVPARNNDGNANHGRLKFTAQGSRFNFTIKGPKLWGAQTTGFLEMDFDTAEAGTASAGFSASHSYTPRLRHAMFRFNWPTSELLLGQYFSMFCEWYAESAEDGPLQMTGTPTARLAQIRFSQTFMNEDITLAALVGDPNQAQLNANSAAVGPYNALINNGQSAESPQVQGKIKYAHDFWGKAAYYGKPIPFTAQVVAGWQRNVLRSGNTVALGTLANLRPATIVDVGLPAAIVNTQNEYLNPWLLMGSLFIPVIPTNSANLAGTASILTQWWIGQGVEAFGFTGVGSNLFKFARNPFNANGTQVYDAHLLKKFGGFVEAQYYFNNQWFLNAVYGVSKAFNVSRARFNFPSIAASGFNGMEWAMGDNAQTIQQVNATLWYRPIQAIKFGLQYSYASATYFAYALPTASATGAPVGLGAANTVNRSHFGDDHRVEFVGFFYF
ncbi:MAG: hypothetical protein A2139_00525 [Desulfobacca sp. RBG_16_60_12]|nr:MAG: hypothetical protein A2139_00525 [Desulfobacca sp. RBG_16_60_12]